MLQILPSWARRVPAVRDAVRVSVEEAEGERGALAQELAALTGAELAAIEPADALVQAAAAAELVARRARTEAADTLARAGKDRRDLGARFDRKRATLERRLRATADARVLAFPAWLQSVVDDVCARRLELPRPPAGEPRGLELSRLREMVRDAGERLPLLDTAAALADIAKMRAEVLALVPQAASRGD